MFNAAGGPPFALCERPTCDPVAELHAGRLVPST